MARSKFVAVIAVSALSSACATTRYTQSRFETVPSGAKGRAAAAVSLEIGTDCVSFP